MNALSFYFAIFLSLVYAGVMAGQVHESTTLEKTARDMRNYQLKIVQADKTSQFVHQLIQRMAIDSEHDPALSALLKKNGVHVTYNTATDTAASSPAPTDDSQKTATASPQP